MGDYACKTRVRKAGEEMSDEVCHAALDNGSDKEWHPGRQNACKGGSFDIINTSSHLSRLSINHSFKTLSGSKQSESESTCCLSVPSDETEPSSLLSSFSSSSKSDSMSGSI